MLMMLLVMLVMNLKRTLQVELQLFGEVHFVERTAWSPFFLMLGSQIGCPGARDLID